jgi:hypothetical protein
MNLVLFSVQQDRPAAATCVIDGVPACTKDGRGLDNMAGARRDNYFEGDLWAGHNDSHQGGSATGLSATDA